MRSSILDEARRATARRAWPNLLLGDVYKNRIAVYTLEGKFKTSWEPGADYGPWISYFYAGIQRVLYGDSRKLTSGPLGGGQTSSLNLGGLFPIYRGVSGGKVSLGISSEGGSESLVMPEDLSSSKRVYKTGSEGKDQAVAWGWCGLYQTGKIGEVLPRGPMESQG